MSRVVTIAFAACAFWGCCKAATETSAMTTADKVEEAMAQITEQEVAYESGGTKLTGFIAYDATQTEPRPGVLVVHEWWGHNDYVRERAKMLAELGYTAMAIDMYGDGKLATHPEDAQKFMQEALSDTERATARFKAAHALLTEHETTDGSKIAAVGYCFGGGVVLHMARAGVDLKAVGSFHGMLGTETPAQPGAVKAKVFAATGAEDPMVPAEQRDAFEAEMKSAGVDYELAVYEGAKHGFTVKAATERGQKMGLPLAYNADADADSWARLQALLKSVF